MTSMAKTEITFQFAVGIVDGGIVVATVTIENDRGVLLARVVRTINNTTNSGKIVFKKYQAPIAFSAT